MAMMLLADLLADLIAFVRLVTIVAPVTVCDSQQATYASPPSLHLFLAASSYAESVRDREHDQRGGDDLLEHHWSHATGRADTSLQPSNLCAEHVECCQLLHWLAATRDRLSVLALLLALVFALVLVFGLAGVDIAVHVVLADKDAPVELSKGREECLLEGVQLEEWDRGGGRV